MQDRIETKKRLLEQLNLRLADLDAERARIQHEVTALKSSLTRETTSDLWSFATVVAVSLVAVISHLSTGVFHDAQSNVIKDDQPELSATSELRTGQRLSVPQAIRDDSALPSRTGKQKRVRHNAKAASTKQWGPLLVMTAPDVGKRYYGFDPVVKSQQKDLLTLGFDVGEADGFKGQRTRQAIAEFRALYLPDSGEQLKDADLAVTMAAYADLARSDAARFGIDHGVVAAIRLSSVRTGVDFAYLMKLAATESNFEPESKAATSSATGLYQFTHDTWLNALKAHGARYGLVADYAAQIEYYVTWSGYRRPILRDKAMYEHLLALRKNPRISAILAAESVIENQQKLEDTLSREPNETDLYLTHFLGADDAITFLESLEQSPGTHAVELFPEAASSNQRIFHPETCAPRTVDEVYSLFDEKLSRRHFEQTSTQTLTTQTGALQGYGSSAVRQAPMPPDRWNLGRAL